MGRGDKRTKKGKIFRGSTGNSRPKNKNKTVESKAPAKKEKKSTERCSCYCVELIYVSVIFTTLSEFWRRIQQGTDPKTSSQQKLLLNEVFESARC